MSSILKHIFFRLVLGVIITIITLHAIIPHPHEDQLTAEGHIKIHKNSNSLIGIIRLTFHENNHSNLDHLNTSQNKLVKKSHPNYKFSNAAILISTLSIIQKRKTKKLVPPNINIDKYLFVNQNRLRGPPLYA